MMDKEMMIEILMEDCATKKEAEKMLSCEPGMPGSVNIYEIPGDFIEMLGFETDEQITLDDIRAGKYAGNVNIVDHKGKEYLVEYVC